LCSTLAGHIVAAAGRQSSRNVARDLEPEFLEVGGRRIRHLIQRGPGDAVVLVHGFGGNLETWRANLEALAAGGRTVAALDLPGHGQSSRDVGSGSLGELAMTVLAYMDAVGIGRTHLVGHSMGAAACLDLIDRAPGRVRSVTLIGPAGTGQKINADFIRGFIAARCREEVEPLLRLLFADPTRVTPQIIDDTLAYKRLEGVTEALAKIAGSRYVGTRSGGALRDILGTVPTLVIWGADDAVVPAAAPGDLAWPGVEVHLVPGRGHMVQVEAAEEVNRLIDEFLSR
jgi:pyruvate dehydrogenase E2 component (dihydrolipoamide acetyltransferase)